MSNKPEVGTNTRIEICINNIVFAFDGEQLNVLLVQVKDDSLKELWMLPTSRWVEGTSDESAEKFARKLVGSKPSFNRQFKTYTYQRNTSNESVVSIAYTSGVRFEDANILGIQNEQNGKWWSVYHLPPIGFGQDTIVQEALEELRQRLYFEPIAFYLAKKIFTIPELQKIYELILNKKFDKRNFSKKIIQSGTLKKSKRPEFDSSKAHSFYSFNAKGYLALKKDSSGSKFEF
ncbi:MAG: hypothetical protein MJZ96_05215 [Paludibacteraceae bacterium]|nr:hypothetical protein [Paludibacteraceae bacterium]